jgi:O-antigen ligase
MNVTPFVIIGATAAGTALLSVFPAIRGWWRAWSSRMTPALLLMAIFTATFLGGQRSATDTALLDPIRIVRIVVICIIVLWSLLLIMQRPNSWRIAGSGAHWMAVYALLAMMSAVYSIQPLLTLWKGFEVLALVLSSIALAGYLRSPADLQWLMDITSLILLFLCLSVLAGLAVDPHEALKSLTLVGSGLQSSGVSEAGRFVVRGVIPGLNPSAVGGIGALLLVSGLVPALNRSRRGSKTSYWIVVCIGTVTVLLSHARTAFISAVLVVMLIAVLRRYFVRAFTLVAFGGAIFFLTVGYGILVTYVLRGQTLHGFADLSGRMVFWPIVLKKIMASPLLGYGYYAAQRVLFGLPTVDNTYLNVLLGLGILGFAVFLVPLLWGLTTFLHTYRRLRREQVMDPLWVQLLAFFMLLLFRSFTATSFETLYHLQVVYMLVLVSLSAWSHLPLESPTKPHLGASSLMETPGSH